MIIFCLEVLKDLRHNCQPCRPYWFTFVLHLFCLSNSYKKMRVLSIIYLIMYIRLMAVSMLGGSGRITCVDGGSS